MTLSNVFPESFESNTEVKTQRDTETTYILHLGPYPSPAEIKIKLRLKNESKLQSLQNKDRSKDISITVLVTSASFDDTPNLMQIRQESQKTISLSSYFDGHTFQLTSLRFSDPEISKVSTVDYNTLKLVINPTRLTRPGISYVYLVLQNRKDKKANSSLQLKIQIIQNIDDKDAEKGDQKPSHPEKENEESEIEKMQETLHLYAFESNLNYTDQEINTRLQAQQIYRDNDKKLSLKELLDSLGNTVDDKVKQQIFDLYVSEHYQALMDKQVQ